MRTIAFFIFAIRYALAEKAENSNLAQDYYATIDSIAGTFNPGTLGYGTTSLANIAHTSGTSQTIAFSFYPINYCQAVRICAPTNKEFSVDTPMTIDPSYCATELFFSPTSGRLEMNDGSDINGYVDQLIFHKGATFHEVFVSETPFARTQLFSPKPQQTNIFNQKLLIIMTNSRQCQVNVNIDGFLRYSDLLTKDRTAATTNLPEIFKYAGNNSPLPTFYTDTSANFQRKQDYLPHVKELTKTSTSLGNIKFSCKIGAGSNNGRSTVSKTSIVHVTKQKYNPTNAVNVLKSETITIEMNNCHWMRIWFTKKPKWEDYKGAIETEIHQTIDLFFNEAFVLLPDRENSVRLPGGAQEIKTMTILHHGNGLGEISFGMLGNDPINIINFKLDILNEADYQIFLIRSPRCDANFGSNAVLNGVFGSGAGAKIMNLVSFKSCEIQSIEKQ